VVIGGRRRESLLSRSRPGGSRSGFSTGRFGEDDIWGRYGKRGVQRLGLTTHVLGGPFGETPVCGFDASVPCRAESVFDPLAAAGRVENAAHRVAHPELGAFGAPLSEAMNSQVMLADLHWQSPAGRGQGHLRPGVIVRYDAYLANLSRVLALGPDTDRLEELEAPALAQRDSLDRPRLFQLLGGEIEDVVDRPTPMAT